MDLEQQVLERANLWTQSPYDDKTTEEVNRLIDQGGDDLIDAFYKDLDFGTGGLRGVMGAGTNRVNKYTFGAATQGLANYINQQFPNQSKSVAIAYDSRNNSKAFARQVAEVLSANQIKVYLFEELRPTPCLSFAIRHLNCSSGIVITASHNPPEYNGYKVYWNDGGQLVPPHDKGVIEEVRKVSPDQVRFDFDESLIEMIGAQVDEAYLNKVQSLSLTDAGKKDLSVVFTSIHGTSITMVPPALKNAGFEKVTIIEEQAEPDGNFPTVKSPNPEEAEALNMAVEKAKAIDADLVIGTDPDADRVGLAVKNTQGEIELINGNQAASVLIYYLLENWRSQGKLNGKQFIAKTIVTSDLLAVIGKAYQVECPNVLTGFKWIADIIKREEGNLEFIGGGEESYGYMIGDFVRDKDAVASAVLLAEAAAWAKAKGSSFYETLLDIYVQFGYYQEALVSITKKGKRGAEEIGEMMESFRTKTPTVLGGETVVEILDYQSSQQKNLQTGESNRIDLPKSNVLQFVTDNGSRITARPSGTEPKIKFYFSVNQKLESKADFIQVREQLMDRIESMKTSLGV
jgi:phosphoglucomutase